MANKNQLRDVVFLLNKNHLQSFYCGFFSSQFHITLVCGADLQKLISKFLDYDESCTNVACEQAHLFG